MKTGQLSIGDGRKSVVVGRGMVRRYGQGGYHTVAAKGKGEGKREETYRSGLCLCVRRPRAGTLPQ